MNAYRTGARPGQQVGVEESFCERCGLRVTRPVWPDRAKLSFAADTVFFLGREWGHPRGELCTPPRIPVVPWWRALAGLLLGGSP